MGTVAANVTATGGQGNTSFVTRNGSGTILNYGYVPQGPTLPDRDEEKSRSKAFEQWTKANASTGYFDFTGDATGSAPASAVSFSDDFNRADGSLGSDWISTSSPLVVLSNAVGGGGSTGARWAVPVTSGTGFGQFAQATYLGANFIGVSVAMPAFSDGSLIASAGTWYSFRKQSGTGGVAIIQKDTGTSTVTVLATATDVPVSGDVMRLEYFNDVLKGFLNGFLVIQHTPIAPITGQDYVGMSHQSASWVGTQVLDDWSGGNVTGSLISGTALGAYDWSGAGTSQVTFKGTNTSIYDFSRGTTTAKRVPKAVANAGGYQWNAGTTTGKRTPKSSTTQAYDFSRGTTTGVVPKKGSTTAAYDWSRITATGYRLPKGSTSNAPYAWSLVSATGDVPPNRGSLVASYAWNAGATTSKRAPKAIAAPYGGTVISSSPAVYLRMGDTSTRALDYSGQNNEGTWNSVPTQASPGLLLNETDPASILSSHWARIQSDPLAATGPFTVSALINPSSLTGSRTIAATYDAENSSGWSFRISSSRLYFLINNVTITSGTTTLTTGATRHVACSYDGTTVRLYLDGVQEASAACTTTAGRYGLWFGAAPTANGTTGSATFNGTMDEAAYFLTALSAPTVLNQYKAALTPVQNYDWSGTGTGKRVAKSTTTGTYAFDKAGVTGSRTPKSNGVGGYDYARINATAKRTPKAAGLSGAYDFSGTGTGDVPPNRGQSVVGQYSMNGAATGFSPIGGYTSGTYAYSGSGVGKKGTSGFALGGFSYSGTSAGKFIQNSSAQGSWTWDGASSGARLPASAGFGAFDYSGFAAGGNYNVGATTSTYAWNLDESAGSRSSSGFAVAELDYAGGGEGSAERLAAASGGYQYACSAVSAAFVSGQSNTTNYQYVGTAQGSNIRRVYAEITIYNVWTRVEILGVGRAGELVTVRPVTS